jgi:hypothetical protein
MAERDEFLADVRIRLEQAQAVYKRHYDRHHRDVKYVVGDWVWLRLRQRAASSLHVPTSGKLKPRFFGPYRITAVINDVAYQLELPPRARLHDVFHVGLLKKFVGTPLSAPPALPQIHNGAVVPEPEHVLRSRLARGVRQLLVHWKGATAASATWEDADSFIDRYPGFQLRDELLVEGGERCHVGPALPAPTTRSGAATTGTEWLGANQERRHVDRHARQARIKEFVSIVSRPRIYILDVIGTLGGQGRITISNLLLLS